MKKAFFKKSTLLASFAIVLGLVRPFPVLADQVSNGGINIQMYLDHTQTGQFWDFTTGNATSIYPGEEVYIRQNTTFSQPERGRLDGSPNGSTVVHWVASNCPPGSSCVQWNYREANPMVFPWWVVLLGANYTGSSAPVLKVRTSLETPPGVYTLNFLAEENPVTWPQPLMNPATQNFTITVLGSAKPGIGVTPSSFNFVGSVGQSAPASQSLVLENTGNANLNWTATTNQPWCHISQASGTNTPSQKTTLSVSVDAPGTSGTLNCTLSISDPNANNNPQRIPVSYQVGSRPEPAQCAFTGTSFRYLRYENTYPVVWAAWRELEFYDTDGHKLSPSIVGGSADWTYPQQGAYGKPSAIDGNLYTQWNGADKGWVSPFSPPIYLILDFGKNVNLGKMRFLTQGETRRDVSIRVGDNSDTQDTLLKNITGYYKDMVWIENNCLAQPTISLVPATLDFSATSGAAAPAAKSVILKNTGTTKLDWTGIPDQNWCHVNPASGSLDPDAAISLDVSVDDPSNVGIFSCAVKIVDPKSSNNPQSMSISYKVSAAPQPAIAVNPARLTFDGISGKTAPAGKTFTITNTGKADLNWTASASMPWCHLSKASGSNKIGGKATVEVTVDDPTNAGTFSCHITISDPKSSNGSQSVSAVYIVADSPKAKISVSPAALAFLAYSGGSAPDPKNLQLTNSGDADLNWTASADVPWCHVFPSSGKLASDQSQKVQVTLDKPSNVGAFNCTVSFEDPAAENSPRPVVITYEVKPFIGDPANVIALAKPCEAVSLAWDAVAGAGQYNIYRNTKNSVPSTALVAGFSGTEYKDTKVAAGTKYYYWVETLGGTLSNAIAAAGNSAGGVLVQACQVSEIPIQPPLVAASSPACETSEIQWTNVVNEDGYRIYRNSTGSAPEDADLIGTAKADDATFLEKMASGSYYYWVSSYNGKGESVRAVSNPAKIFVASCEADLSASDKNIISINGAVQERSICDMDRFQGLPSAKTVLQLNDILTYEINLCNTAKLKDAKEVVVTDELTNLDSPAGGLSVKLDGQVITESASVNPKTGEYHYDSSTRKLTMNVGKVKKQDQRHLTYNVVVKTQANYSSICPRCQNKAVITYGKDDSTASTVELHSPAIFYAVKPNTVSY